MALAWVTLLSIANWIKLLDQSSFPLHPRGLIAALKLIMSRTVFEDTLGLVTLPT